MSIEEELTDENMQLADEIGHLRRKLKVATVKIKRLKASVANLEEEKTSLQRDIDILTGYMANLPR